MDPLSEKIKQEKKIVLQDVHLKNNPMGSDSVIVIPAKVHQKFIPPLIYRVSGTAGNNDADRLSKGTKDKMRRQSQEGNWSDQNWVYPVPSVTCLYFPCLGLGEEKSISVTTTS